MVSKKYKGKSEEIGERSNILSLGLFAPSPFPHMLNRESILPFPDEFPLTTCGDDGWGSRFTTYFSLFTSYPLPLRFTLIQATKCNPFSSTRFIALRSNSGEE